MDLQNVKNLTIPEGSVKTIHDKNNVLLWGAVGYNAKYAGDTTQQTYTGKNLIAPADLHNGSFVNYSQLQDNTYTETDNTKYRTVRIENLPAGTYTISINWENTARWLRIGTDDTIIPIGTDANKYTFTTNTTGLFGITFRNTVSSNFSDDDYTIQLESGSTATSYEPYVGGVASPNPDYPQNVNVVTGTQTVTISDGANSEDFAIGLGTIEFCKIGTYQDYIYKSGDDWYVHKAIGKTVLDGTEDWFKSGTSAIDRFGVPNTYFGGVTSMSSSTTISDHFIYNSGAIYGTYHISGTNIYFDYTPNGTTTKDQWVSWLSSNHTTVYYVVGTPTDTKITDATLIAQLDAVHQFLTRYGYNGAVSGNLPMIIDKTNL